MKLEMKGRSALGWTQRDIEDLKDLLVKANDYNLPLVLEQVSKELMHRVVRRQGLVK